MDEAGRGPLAGPVVAGAVILRRFDFTVPLDDSKRLTPLARERAYRQILRAGAVGVGAAGPEEIDRYGIHAATHRAMLRALSKLPAVPRLVLVDGLFVPPGCPYPAVAVVKGDGRSLAIAAASIVAKVVRDQWMGLIHRLHPEYGFRRHKGYGTEDHMRRIGAIGPCAFHRYSFSPLRKRATSASEGGWQPRTGSSPPPDSPIRQKQSVLLGEISHLPQHSPSSR